MCTGSQRYNLVDDTTPHNSPIGDISLQQASVLNYQRREYSQNVIRRAQSIASKPAYFKFDAQSSLIHSVQTAFQEFLAESVSTILAQIIVAACHSGPEMHCA